VLKRVGTVLPRLGFLGLGWIGRHRMAALAESGLVEIAALADEDPAALEAAARIAPQAAPAAGLDDLLSLSLDGIVIATPSGMHADQAIAALGAGCAVLCQKPLARNEAEAARVVAAARRADRRLGVDLSYRHTVALQALRTEIESGRAGRVHAADLTFHNAYGPDKPWFHDRNLSGGGCLIDLGVHLIDAALWLTGATDARCLSSALFHRTTRLPANDERVEDLAFAMLELLPRGEVIRIACSWNLPTGCDAVIGVEVFGSDGGLAMRNVGGSFYDFEACRTVGTRREVLAAPPDDWGGRGVTAWASAFAVDASFDPAAEGLVVLSRAIDAIYAAA
jgi:predicted dehydrogenase